MPAWAWILLSVGLGASAAIAVSWFIGVGPRLLITLANHEAWWSPLRPMPPEGQMFVILKGGPDGPFERILHSVKGFSIDPVTHEFRPGDQDAKNRTRLEKNYGITWVGFNRSLLVRETKYDKWERLPNSAEYGLVSKTRRSPAIYFQYLMAAKVENAETTGNYPVDAMISFTTQLFAPEKALFFAGGWETQATSAVQGAVREYVGTRNIDELRKEKAASGGDNLINKILGLDLSLHGIKIVAATFIDYDLEQADAEANRAARAAETARLESEARVIAARNDKLAAIARAEGEAEAERIRAQGERDADITKAEAIQKLWEAKRKGGGDQAGNFAIAEAIAGNPNITALGGSIMTMVSPKEKGDTAG